MLLVSAKKIAYNFMKHFDACRCDALVPAHLSHIQKHNCEEISCNLLYEVRIHLLHRQSG